MPNNLYPLNKQKTRWRIRVFLRKDTDPTTGKKKNIYHSENFKGKKREAENRRNELQFKHNKGQLAESQSMSLNDYLDRWLTDSLRGEVSHRTFSGYSEYLDRYVRGKLGNKQLSKLTALDFQGLYTAMMTRGLSPRTVRHLHNVLSKSLNQAVRWGFLTTNVVKLAQAPTVKRKREMRALTPEQANTFLEFAEGTRLYVMWVLALETGMRPEEYLALQWKDLNNNALMVKRVYCRNRKGGGWYFETPKTELSKRRIPLTKNLLGLLRKHKIEQMENRLKAGKSWHDHDLIFCGLEGKPLVPCNIHQRYFKPVLKKAGLPDIRIYDLRHTCATLFLAENVPAKVVSERLGHASITITLDTYSHVLPDMQDKATEVFENILAKARRKKKKNLHVDSRKSPRSRPKQK